MTQSYEQILKKTNRGKNLKGSKHKKTRHKAWLSLTFKIYEQSISMQI